MPAPDDRLRVITEAFSTCETIDAFLYGWLQGRFLPPAEQAVFDHYYASFRASFSPRLRAHYRDQTREVCALIAAHDRPRVLEVGAGCGTESLWFALSGARVTALDVRADRLAVARRRRDLLRAALAVPLPAEFRLDSLLEHDAPPYDIVWLEHTFHHLEPRLRVTEAIARLVRPGGYVVASEVNPLNPALQLQMFLERGARTIDTFIDENGRPHLYGVERLVSARAMRRLFEQVGFVTETVRYFRLFPNHPIFARLGPIERFATRIPLPPIFTSYNFVARKASSR